MVTYLNQTFQTGEHILTYTNFPKCEIGEVLVSSSQLVPGGVTRRGAVAAVPFTIGTIYTPAGCQKVLKQNAANVIAHCFFLLVFDKGRISPCDLQERQKKTMDPERPPEPVGAIPAESKEDPKKVDSEQALSAEPEPEFVDIKGDQEVQNRTKEGERPPSEPQPK